jgi:hypothetical protein
MRWVRRAVAFERLAEVHRVERFEMSAQSGSADPYGRRDPPVFLKTLRRSPRFSKMKML